MKKLQILGFILLSIASLIYTYKQPDTSSTSKETHLYVTLEGAFQKTGDIEIKEGMSLHELVKKVGVKEDANLKALSLDRTVRAESRIYLPYQRTHTISLNHGTSEDFMTLEGVGEKTAQKIIDYRKKNQFYAIEDIMNVPGIGEKKYLKYRDYLCL